MNPMQLSFLTLKVRRLPIKSMIYANVMSRQILMFFPKCFPLGQCQLSLHFEIDMHLNLFKLKAFKLIISSFLSNLRFHFRWERLQKNGCVLR